MIMIFTFLEIFQSNEQDRISMIYGSVQGCLYPLVRRIFQFGVFSDWTVVVLCRALPCVFRALWVRLPLVSHLARGSYKQLQWQS